MCVNKLCINMKWNSLRYVQVLQIQWSWINVQSLQPWNINGNIVMKNKLLEQCYR